MLRNQSIVSLFLVMMMTTFMPGLLHAQAATQNQKAAPGQVALFANYGSGTQDMGVIIARILALPLEDQQISHVSTQDDPDPALFEEAAVVVIGAMSKSTQAWSDQQIAQVEAYVRQGGHVIMIATAPMLLAGQGRDLTRLQTLLGAGYWGGSRQGMQLQANHPMTKGIEPRDYPWFSHGQVLGKLTTAQKVIGNDKGHALVTHNKLGEGSVMYFAPEVSRMRSFDQADVTAYLALLENAIRLANPKQEVIDRKGWGLKPLGPEATPLEARNINPPQRQKLEPTLKASSATGEPVKLLRAGRPVFVLVTADEPSAATKRAAEELQRAFARMTNQPLPIYRESQMKWAGQGETLKATAAADGAQDAFESVIVLGDTSLGRSQGITARELPDEGYHLQSKGSVLFVVGNDLTAGGKVVNGTLHATMGLLERHVGFRWLWPGPLGEVVPKHENLAIGPVNETDAPAIRQRRLRNSNTASLVNDQFEPAERGSVVHDVTNLTAPLDAKVELHPRSVVGLKNLGIVDPQQATMVVRNSPWFYHHRLGSSLKLHYTHAYGGMWQKYGQSHPQWFALQPEGSRTQNPSRERLCVSNPALAEQVASDVIARLKADPTLTAASISPNDGSAANNFCMCEDCRKLDPPAGPKLRLMLTIHGVRNYREYPSLTDRYVTFYNRIARQVAKEMPDRWVGAYAYSAYRTPPLHENVEPNILVGFVGLGYFNEHGRQRDLRNWDGWAEKTSLLMLRPNLFHGGNGFLANYAHKLGEDIKHCYTTGMVATDFDTVMNHWSTQGLNYYVAAKLLWDPSQDVNVIIQDYCDSGFGPAGPIVRQYFDRIEAITSNAAAAAAAILSDTNLEDREDTGLGGMGPLADRYTPEVIAELAGLLEQARRAVKGDDVMLARIDFLALGLEHADYQSTLVRMYDHRGEVDVKQAQAVLDKRHDLYMRILRQQPLALNVAWHNWSQGPVLSRAFEWKPPQD